MPESTSTTSELTSQYSNQVASDLDRNAKEQERIAAEITTLQQQLASLQHDHTVLLHMQEALGLAVASPEPTSTESTTVPSPRGQTKRRNGSDATATERPAAGSSRRDVTKTVQPTLVELVRRHLNEQNEPRSAVEVATALSQKHPQRGVKATVVRTTLENLVAKSQAQRTTQGRSVFYTASNASMLSVAPESEERPETTA